MKKVVGWDAWSGDGYEEVSEDLSIECSPCPYVR